MIVKDADYWKEYNQKRKEKGYFRQNYLQRKGEVVKDVELKKVVKLEPVVKSVVKTELENILQPKPEPNILQPKKLWKDFYTGLKPHCQSCLKKGIGAEEYNFCSTEKKPVIIRNENGGIFHVFRENYACLVYHWTKFQGQGQIKPSVNKNTYQNATKNNSSEQKYSNYQNSIKL